MKNFKHFVIDGNDGDGQPIAGFVNETDARNWVDGQGRQGLTTLKLATYDEVKGKLLEPTG